MASEIAAFEHATPASRASQAGVGYIVFLSSGCTLYGVTDESLVSSTLSAHMVWSSSPRGTWKCAATFMAYPHLYFVPQAPAEPRPGHDVNDD